MYRIIKRGNTELYMVQKRFLWFFWLDKLGDSFPLCLKEAKVYLDMFIAHDKHIMDLKAPNTVVEQRYI